MQDNRELFNSTHQDKEPTRWSLFIYEIRSRRGLDILLALVLRLPVLGNRLRQKLSKKFICSFLAFDDDTDSKIGCLIHPSRMHGADLRQEVAFRLLKGLNCGASDFYCNSALLFDRASETEKLDFIEENKSADWYQYSCNTQGFETDKHKKAEEKQCQSLPIKQ